MRTSSGQLEPGLTIGGYRIDELIGRGGMGVVYRVTNVALNRIYALKLLAPELAEDEAFRHRFKREMRIAASIKHPNVVGLHYAGEQDGLVYFVMDFVAGSDLLQTLRMSGAMWPERAVELLAQCAAALDAAHRRGLVHRDVKPANVLLTVRDGEEHVYLTDFGVAKRFDSVAGLTAQGAVVGTVDYMSPEQITGGDTDARTDIYALGCVFFQMLTAKVPYERENSVAKLFAHVHDPPPALDGQLERLYPLFGQVIEKALAKEPRDRYLSAGDFARDAAAALHGARDSGQATLVATGEARPSDVDQVASQQVSAEKREPPADTDPAHTEPASGPDPKPPRPSILAAAMPAAEPRTPGADPAPNAKRAPAANTPAVRSLARYRWAAVALLVLVGGAIAAIVALGSGSSQSTPAGERFVSSARAVPDNRVTGTGAASVQLHGNVATVTIQTTGLLNGSAHLMHIHAGGQGICPPASAAHLHNGHRTISTTDGLKYYGPPVVSLTTRGDTSASSNLDFRRYPSSGNIRYTRTVTITPGAAAAIRAGDALIVVHGIDYNANGVYDDVLDRSELNNALPGEATAPALCGPLINADALTQTPTRSRPTNISFTANLGTT